MFPDRLNRRDLLKHSALGFGALARNSLLSEVAAGSPTPHFEPKVKRVIFLFMKGGPSAIDTFDPKPLLDRDHGLAPHVTPARITRAAAVEQLAAMGITGSIEVWGVWRAVHTRHGESRTTGLAALANRLAVWRSGFLISVSEQASAISRAEGAPSERVRVIRNGIDLGRVELAERL